MNIDTVIHKSCKKVEPKFNSLDIQSNYWITLSIFQT